ncbi:PA14 domain-containing protein [Actinacidiphila bryophytorum]|uniref:Glycosyl hydrolases family 2 n=1 Tax=Actinacidiphila bryophytorum TaxID=1436133 RepID=A0A9W4MIE5_9ACTN|nr:PA14 domain-containing protein [Actinacidiphila bryophytorum]MBM9437100.1 glycoside hydrolase family 2 [Actinacidiphila bryophytorum]MBN6542035.1 glycoside hydrolase family 2 [Actinacidiphila bryophytorum]CAG7646639.1 Glycosyl hydrolases family 2 [Actinacidiphila bryophytorum]
MRSGRIRLPKRRRLAALVTLLLGAALITPATAGALQAPQDATAAADTPQGLRADYYLSTDATSLDFATYSSTGVEPSLNVPDLLPSLRDNAGSTLNVAVHWTGQLDVPAGGTYTFYIKGDNGFRMSLDGSSVIDHWTTDWDVQTTSEPITLTAGAHTLAFDYNQGNGGAYITTEWSGPGITRQAIPDSALHLPAGFTPPTVDAAVDTSGRTATLQLPGAVTALPQDIGKHLAVIAGSNRWTPTVAVNPADASQLLLTAGESDTPAALKSKVRVSYDGQGDLTTAAGEVPLLSGLATNNSTWYFATKWAKDVSPANALPDYPRPQLTRDRWQNLNGTWQFQATDENAALPAGKLSGSILVPYPMEAPLSGVAEHHDWSLYQRSFTVPRTWQVGSDNRLRLNFGAVDYETWVYVNGRQVAHHVGGYEAFTADVTDALKGRGPQTLLLKVKDTTDDQTPTGKQSRDPSGIWYTPTSGIWQTVWLEPVPEASIDSLVLTPDLADESLAVTVRPAAGTPASARVTATAYAGRTPVGTVTGTAGTKLRLKVPHPELWSPDHPYLYDLKVTLSSGRSHDEVGSYFGMRSIAVADVGGVNKIELNGRPTFVLATLDQGFWPDGIYTAPTDAALRSDLEVHKQLGFNAVRKHIKVEPARWYYWADRLGLMVWQDMPSRNAGPTATAASDQAFTDQVHEIVDQHISSPSVVIWTMTNEGWGEKTKEATGALADAVKQQDPSRLVDPASGVNCCASKGDSGRGDLIDHHLYHGPAAPSPDATRAAVDGEHGGYSLTIPGHILGVSGGQNYGDVPTIEELTKAYVANTSQLLAGAAAGISGSVYTQISDVEGELNGLVTYDRAVLKVEPGPVRDINRQLIAAGAAAGAP